MKQDNQARMIHLTVRKSKGYGMVTPHPPSTEHGYLLTQTLWQFGPEYGYLGTVRTTPAVIMWPIIHQSSLAIGSSVKGVHPWICMVNYMVKLYCIKWEITTNSLYFSVKKCLVCLLFLNTYCIVVYRNLKNTKIFFRDTKLEHRGNFIYMYMCVCVCVYVCVCVCLFCYTCEDQMSPQG